MRRPSAAPTVAGAGGVLLVLLVAVNLRPALATIGPVLAEVDADLGLSATQLAVLTAGPVFCLGLFAPVAAWLARTRGLRPSVLLVLGAVAAGLALRVLGDVPVLFAGTLLAAAGIAVGNVLVPALVREEHPARVGLLMGLYTVALSGSASVASAVTAPIASTGAGWRGALGAWSLLALVALAVWWPASRGRRPDRAALPAPGRGVLREPLAWAVTGYFAVQALTFYTTLTWLAPVLRDAGTAPTRAGLLLALLTLVQLPASLVVPVLAARLRSQRPLMACASVLSVAGLCGLAAAPTTLPGLWVVLLGLGQGTGFALALSLIVLRTRSGPQTASLSAMTQSVGYTAAGLGPLLAGTLNAATGAWAPALLLLVALLGVQLLPGWRAAGPGLLGADQAADLDTRAGRRGQ